MKSRFQCLMMGAAVGFISSAALAFQESKGSADAAAGAPAKVELDTRGTGTSIDASGKGAGFEVRIPGLGKLGVLPKFDFGLELLYGVNDAKSQDPQDRLREPGADEGTQIRGSLKHRF